MFITKMNDTPETVESNVENLWKSFSTPLLETTSEIYGLSKKHGGGMTEWMMLFKKKEFNINSSKRLVPTPLIST